MALCGHFSEKGPRLYIHFKKTTKENPLDYSMMLLVRSAIKATLAYENVKGDAEVSVEAAKVFASAEILLLGNESQSVGPEDAPMAVHLTLLGSDVVLLEGIRLSEVSEGVYFLNAAPLNLSGADGSPCRAVLIDIDER